VHTQLRRGIIRRFPSGIFYLIEDAAIVVVGVFHGRRDPRRWESRV